MLTKTHMDLADQWDRAMGKLDLQEDHIVVIEICMMMGTSLLNAIFHSRGISPEAIDQNHTDRPDIPPEVAAKITPDVRAIMDELAYVEKMRKLHCRGWYPDVLERDLPEWDPPVADKCVAIIRKMQTFTQAVLNE